MIFNVFKVPLTISKHIHFGFGHCQNLPAIPDGGFEENSCGGLMAPTHVKQIGSRQKKNNITLTFMTRNWLLVQSSNFEPLFCENDLVNLDC